MTTRMRMTQKEKVERLKNSFLSQIEHCRFWEKEGQIIKLYAECAKLKGMAYGLSIMGCDAWMLCETKFTYYIQKYEQLEKQLWRA